MTIRLEISLFSNIFARWFGQKDKDVITIARPGNILLLLVRGAFLALIVGLATGGLFYFERAEGLYQGIEVFLAVILLGVLVILADLFTKHKQITTISAIFFGLLMGFLLGSLLWMALEPVIRQYMREHPDMVDPARLLIILICCYISVSMLLQTKDEFRFIIPYVEFSKQVRGGRPLVLDTSVIIDGRIADICETGIIDTKLVVPRFVLQELQGIADSSDKIKRNRGRRGLDVLKRLQNNPKIEVQLHEANLTELRDVSKVDERLVILAQFLSGRVVTNDFNLNKIAQLQGVEVINLNELANAMKLVALPGEQLTIRIIKQGDQVGQGVGYLDDGTMVVVEQGKHAIGQEVDITVTSVLQTPAGRMIFGRIEGRTYVSSSAATHVQKGGGQ